ncbi:DUF6538 domain-containing protein [Thiobacillus sp.]|uniref:DUF6538 domain-containing protein n=1 Tax=Thiobacillus sp. TaxID=924 RepID=UPI0035253CB6
MGGTKKWSKAYGALDLCTPSYLFSRGGIFCFRIAIPARLRPALSGLTEFRCSLFTQD